MKVLIACEYSGIVRDAFSKRGHDAWSCDLLPTESNGNHIQGDIIDILNNGWDLMIAHPPCTYLSYVANRVWNEFGRDKKREKAMQFFMILINAPIEKICVENPMGYPHKVYRKCDQIIHPYYFGDSELKRTCLWLKNLPLLYHYKEDNFFNKQTHVKKPEPKYISKGEKTRGKKIYFVEAMKGTKDRAKERSKSWIGIANAMAIQWG